MLDSLHIAGLNSVLQLVEFKVNLTRNQKFMLYDVWHLMCGDLLLCNPAHGILEAPSRIVPGRPTAPPGAPPSVEGACEGLMDPLQLVLTYLQPATAQKYQDPSINQEKSNWEMSVPHVLTMLSLGCPCCLRSMARLFICSMVSLAIAM